MSDPLISFGLAKDWIQKLLGLWSEVLRDRRAEIEEIKNVFGDPELLAPYYVEPDCQPFNPADHHEEEPIRAFRQPIRDWLNRFLEGPFRERDGRNTVFLLSDAGMGKSSLLMMLKLTHLVRFWPSGLRFVLHKLGPESLKVIDALDRRSDTVLLLDALDEDRTAWGRIEERLAELLRAGESFRQVVITCRTQFFPKVGEAPVEKAGKIEVAGYVANLLYLSSFSDAQVDAYLLKVYPNRVVDRIRKWIRGVDNPNLERARRLIPPMESLRMRPMLLAHVRDLMEADVERWTSYGIYRALVGNWLLREERKLKSRITREQLWQACRAVAMELQARGVRLLELVDLQALLARHPAAKHLREIDVGGRSLLNRTSEGSFRFAHYSIQEFLVADALIERWAAGGEGDERLRMTDQILAFLYAWIEEDPAPRLARVPWRRLDLGDWRPESRGLDLRSADLAGAELRGALLAGADLRDADLREADLREADLRGTALGLAQTVGARFEGAVLQTPGVALEEPLTGTSFEWIPGGSFRMGSRHGHEASIHKVQLSPFWLAVTPVTRRQYAIFLERTGYEDPEHWNVRRFSRPEQPVVGVSWHDAMAYCRWLREATGQVIALPTEAQWEFAARGPESREYPWGKEAPDASRACYGRSWKKEAPADVGSFADGRGPFGHLDLAGNVWEWCYDAWDEEAYVKRVGKGKVVDPIVEGREDSPRVLRGGGWRDPAEYLRAAVRRRLPAGLRFGDIGFRLAAAPAST